MKLNADAKIVCLILILAVVFAVWAKPHREGDGVSYYMMVSSLAQDGDLILDSRDEARWNKENFEGIPVGVYVRFDDKGYMRYAKPALYPLFAAPFLFVIGRYGLVVLNGLLLGMIVVFSYLGLRRYIRRLDAFLLASGFFAFSFIPAYISWMTPDILLFFACSLCVYLLSTDKPIACALIIGLIGAEKPAFLSMLVPLTAFVAFGRKPGQIVKTLTTCFLGAILSLLLNFCFLKTFYAYSDPKYMVSGGMVPHTLEELHSRLVLAPAELLDMRFNNWPLFIKNVINFFVGRFSGMFWYGFPALVCVVIYLWRRKKLAAEEKAQNDSILSAAVLLMAILLFFRPLNYFGGLGFWGTRYFYIFPALLLPAAFKGMKRPWLVFLFFLPAFWISSQVLNSSLSIKAWGSSVWRERNVLSFSVHTCKEPLRYAPLEINTIENLMVYNRAFPEELTFYAPLGVKKDPKGLFIFERGQEMVFLARNECAALALETTAGEFILRPVLTLRDKSGQKRKAFFYFKPSQGLGLIKAGPF
ncbi:MAG: hypothetical protein M0R35_00540 [Candidatus Omnitrophica bacterium]|jgi:hypothetical protein|nr:hypothetical protein [Candidatus Omnitrophota bacterium]